MDIVTIQQKIEKRVQEQVENDVKMFRKAVTEAAGKLFDEWNPQSDSRCVLVACEIISKSKREWPKELWDMRRIKITNEIMSTMDAMQQMLLANPKGDITPTIDEEVKS